MSDDMMEEYQLPSGHVFMGLTHFSQGPGKDTKVVAKCSCGWEASSPGWPMMGMSHAERLEFMGVPAHLDRGRNVVTKKLVAIQP